MLDWNNCVNSAGIPTLKCVPVFLKQVINGFMLFAGVVAVVFILIAGIRYISSQGDPLKVAQARRTLTYALIGLGIVIASVAFLYILSAVTGSNCLKSIGFGC